MKLFCLLSLFGFVALPQGGMAQSGCEPECCTWGPWVDRDNPGGYGDYETLNDWPGGACENPVCIEARTVGSHIPAHLTGEVITYDTVTGFACVNRNQPDRRCNFDYEARICCPNDDCDPRCPDDKFGCCEGPCWEKCLFNPPDAYAVYYSKYLLPMIHGARSQRFQNGGQGSVFLFDSAADATTFQFEKVLGQIVALTLPVEFDEEHPDMSCNPFFVVQYDEQGTGDPIPFQCVDHCVAAGVINSLNPVPETSWSDNLDAGCAFAHTYRNNHPNIPCSPAQHSLDELLIAFVNSNDQLCVNNFCPTFWGTLPTNKVLITVPNGAVPGTCFNPGYHIDVDPVAGAAAAHLLSCMKKECCRREDDVVDRSPDEVIGYVGVDREGNLGEPVFGTLEEIRSVYGKEAGAMFDSADDSEPALKEEEDGDLALKGRQ